MLFVYNVTHIIVVKVLENILVWDIIVKQMRAAADIKFLSVERPYLHDTGSVTIRFALTLIFRITESFSFRITRFLWQLRIINI